MRFTVSDEQIAWIAMSRDEEPWSWGVRMWDEWRRRMRRFALGLGLFLLLIGLFLFARDMGWVPQVSVWSVLLVGVGIWIMVWALR